MVLVDHQKRRKARHLEHAGNHLKYELDNNIILQTDESIGSAKRCLVWWISYLWVNSFGVDNATITFDDTNTNGAGSMQISHCMQSNVTETLERICTYTIRIVAMAVKRIRANNWIIEEYAKDERRFLKFHFFQFL